MSDKLIQSYVWHGDKAFFVSTINRVTSAALAQGMIYAETMVWEWDAKTRERGKRIGQDEDTRDSIHTHIAVCERLQKTGKCEIEDEE